LFSANLLASLLQWMPTLGPGVEPMKTLWLLPAFTGVLLYTDASQAAPTNDFFADSTRMEGTNWAYIGDTALATLEPGEPYPGYSNTIWVSWAPQFSARGRYNRTRPGSVQPIKLYTGPTVNSLVPVRGIDMAFSRTDFLAVGGTVYHFQISGPYEANFTGQLRQWPPASNDQFVDAGRLAGEIVNAIPGPELFPINDATTEFGEPAHLDGTPFKSLWWHWTAPVHGTAAFNAGKSTATNINIAVYRGDSIAALSLITKAKNNVSFAVTGGNEYYFAAAAETNAFGDVILAGGISVQSTTPRAVPGNLLREPSWEGTAISEAIYWGMSGSVGGSVGGFDGCDGSTWPTLGNSAQVWQDIETVPGREHVIRFAMRAKSSHVGGGAGDGRVRVDWDGQEVGVAVLPASEVGFWHWANITAVATYPTSRVSFVNLARNIELDAFSVVELNQPPQITSPPTSVSAISGATAAFVVGATGSPTLTYHWSFNGAPHSVLETPVFILDPVTTNQAGTYQVTVSNAYGVATSAPVTLTIEAPTQPVILWQPYGDTVGVGGYFSLNVLAAGTPPLLYQWYKDNVPVDGLTNRTFVIPSVDYTNGGVYSVRVENEAGSVRSLDATLVVTDAINGGGRMNFANRVATPSLDAPVFDIDTVNPLNGSNYVAQLYGGPSLALIRPTGEPRAFGAGFDAGYFSPATVILPSVPPGSNAVLQVRVWDSDKGSTYEEARFSGGKFGKSEVFITQTGDEVQPANLDGLESFSLQVGLPQFTQGLISLVEREPGGVVVWSHHGEPGSRYVIERSFLGFEWSPYLVITNETSDVSFTDSANSGSAALFYRSRILD